MAATDLRVGFVGCGVHARDTLLPAVQRVGMELAAICDLDRRLAQRTTRRFGAFRAYQDVRTMVDEMDLDAVLICGPPDLHAEAAPVALAAGCHVWVEMPAAPSAEEAQRIAGIADERKLVAQAGLNARFAPVYTRLREIALAPDFGEMASVEIVWWPPRTHGHDVPVLFDLPHAIDLVRYLGGEVQDLSVTRGSDASVLAIAFALESGAIATISFAGPVECPRERVQVASLRSTVMATARREVALQSADREDLQVWQYDALRVQGAQTSWDPSGYIAQLQHFVEAIEGETRLQATIADAASAMRLAERVAACERS